MENLQRTGSFKARGAFNKLLALPEAARGAFAAIVGKPFSVEELKRAVLAEGDDR